MTVLRLMLVALLLAAVWVLADGRAALALLAGADLRWLAAALLALHAQTVLSALRWRLVARGFGIEIAQGLAIREYYAAQLVNQTLPGGVLGDTARAARARGQAGLGVAAASVVLERGLGQAAMAVALGLGLALSGGMPWPAGLRAAVLAVLAVAALVLVLAARVKPGWTFKALAALRPHALHHAALSAVILALNLAAFAAAARATGTALSPTAILALIPLILTAMLMPLSVGGWGWREGAAAALFPVADVAAAAGLAASAAFGGLILLAALPGVFWLIRSRPAGPADLPPPPRLLGWQFKRRPPPCL